MAAAAKKTAKPAKNPNAERKSETGVDETQAPLMERRSDGHSAPYKRSIYALSVPVQVVVGTARPTVAELLKLTDGSLITLGSKIDDPVDLCIDNRVIARGELIETDPATGALGVRVTEIVDISGDMLS